MVIFIDNVII